jgi:hypothetical protein
MGSRWNFNPMNIFGLVMVALYIGCGIYLLISHAFDYIPSEMRIIFGILLLLYGIYRGARIFFKLKNPES